MPKRVLIALAVLPVAGVIAACSSDVCHQIVSIEDQQAQQVDGCFADSGFVVPGADAGAEIAQCEQDLKSCSSSDQTVLQQTVDCDQSLPQFQCAWLTNPDAGGYAAYQAQSTACNNRALDAGVSAACKAAFSN